MLLGVDPLEGILDAKLLVCGLKLLAANLLLLATTGGLEAAVVHAIVVEDDLHATAAIGDLIRLMERLGEGGALELDGIIEGLSHFSSFLVVNKIILPGNYLKAHSYFQIT